MTAEAEIEKLNELTEKVIGAAYLVANQLGNGFVEKVYENALIVELKKAALNVEPQHKWQVKYDKFIVGEFFTDLLVEEKIIVEVKAVNRLDEIHLAQCLNYLKASGLKLCLLLNFGKPKVEVKRIVNNF